MTNDTEADKKQRLMEHVNELRETQTFVPLEDA